MHPISFVLCVILTAVPLSAKASAGSCPEQPEITVVSNDPAEIHRVCNASTIALSTLARFNLRPKRQITIKIVDTAIESRDYIGYGSYDSRSDTIELMSYRSILYGYENPQLFGEFFDLIHYTGVVAHEITHAVFKHHTTATSPGTANQEYLAYAIQLSVLPEDRRNDIITRMNVSAWMPGDAISDIYMALEPGRFSVKSYKHLTTISDPEGFIKTLLNSKWFYVYIP